MSKAFSLSLELIYLMDWLLKSEKQKIKILIKSALKNGLLEEIEKIKNLPQNHNQQLFLHNTILNFFIHLENTLLEYIEKKNASTKTKEILKPTLQKIRTYNIDPKTILLSIRETRHHAQTENSSELKKTLFLELLKHWEPNKEDLPN